MKVDTFTGVYLPDGDVIFVDDNGGIRQCARFFSLMGQTPLCGKGILLGSDDEGETQGAKIDLQWLKDLVEFYACDVTRRLPLIGPTMTPWMEGDPTMEIFG
jgi:hypothetical protein